MGVYRSKKTKRIVTQFQFRARRYKKEGFKTFEDARLWEAAMRVQVGAALNQTPSISFRLGATKYLSHCQARMKPNTVRQKAFVFRTMPAFLGNDIPVESINRVLLEDYLQYRALKAGNTAADRDLQDLKALFNSRPTSCGG